MANAKRQSVGVITVLAGLAVLLPAETLTAEPYKANPFAAPARCTQSSCAIGKIATAPFDLWPLARPPQRRADRVVLQLGVGF